MYSASVNCVDVFFVALNLAKEKLLHRCGVTQGNLLYKKHVDICVDTLCIYMFYYS